MTLRITDEEGSSSGALLRLEGRVVAEWAAVLERECRGLLRSRGAVSLDLAGVNFVDRAGLEVLARLSHAGVEIRGCSRLVASVLEGEGVRVTADADGVDEGARSRVQGPTDSLEGGDTGGVGNELFRSVHSLKKEELS